MGFHAPLDENRPVDWRGQVGAASGPALTDPQAMSLDFSGVGEYMLNSTNQAIGIANAWTVMCWVRPNGLSSRMLWQILGATSASRLNIQQGSTGQCIVVIIDTSGTPTGVATWNGVLADATWSHLVLTWNGTTMQLYEDGASLGAPDTGDQSPVLTMADDSRSIAFAATTVGGSAWPGIGSQLAIWRVALTADEITAIYNGGLLVNELDLNGVINDYVSGGDLAHWYRLGHQGSPDLGADYATAGFTPTIDIEVNSSGITDADRSAVLPP